MILGFFDFLKNNQNITLVVSIVSIFLALVIMWIIKIHEHKKKGTKYPTSQVAAIAIFSGLSVLLYFFPAFPLPIPFIPTFLTVNFSLLPILLLGFMAGPFEAVTAVFMRCIIKLCFGSHTACVGEIADLIIGVAVVLSTSLMYIKFHTKKGAFASLSVGVGVWVLASVISNYFVNLPFYILLLGEDVVMSMLKVLPGVNETNYMAKYILYGVIPFNIILSVVVSLITFAVYKKVSYLFKKLDKKKIETNDESLENNTNSTETLKEN